MANEFDIAECLSLEGMDLPVNIVEWSLKDLNSQLTILSLSAGEANLHG